MAKRKVMRMPNSYGTVKKLSGNRRRPYMAGVNPRINDKGSYSYDVLGYYEDRTQAMIALAEYNKNPIDLSNRNITFSDVYTAYYEEKFNSKKKLSKKSEYAAQAAFKNCASLHNVPFTNIRHADLQRVIDNCQLKHSSLELILSLFHQMYAFALREDIVQKDASACVKINVPDDDEHGIRIAAEDIDKLWAHTDLPIARLALIYIYTGWRATELLDMPITDIDLVNMTMTGGKKTTAGKERIVPIHHKIQGFVHDFCSSSGAYILGDDKPRSYTYISKLFYQMLSECGITVRYTLHDCRHTFSSLLSDAGTPQVIHNLLMGHAGKTLDEKVYIHKTLEQLREAIERLP